MSLEDELRLERLLEPMIKEGLDDFFCTNEFSSFNVLEEKIDRLIELARIEDRVELAKKTLDKFETYMENVGRLNDMINEFKGIVAMARAQFQRNKPEKDKSKLYWNKEEEAKPDYGVVVVMWKECPLCRIKELHTHNSTETFNRPFTGVYLKAESHPYCPERWKEDYWSPQKPDYWAYVNLPEFKE